MAVASCGLFVFALLHGAVVVSGAFLSSARHDWAQNKSLGVLASDDAGIDDEAGKVSGLQTWPQVLLTHLSHEGSHAICQGFMKLCIEADCSEDHDAYHHGCASAEGCRVPWADVAPLGGVTLLNTKEVVAPNMLKGYKPTVIILLRSNLLDYSLSVYGKRHMERYGYGNSGKTTNDPQFIPGKIPAPEYYDVSEVHQNAEEILLQWTNRVMFMDSLRAQGSPYRIMSYELFQAQPDEYMERVAKTVGYEVKARRCELQADWSGKKVSGGFVHEAHPGSWLDYVTNHDEIVKSFYKSNYPSLETKCGAHWANFIY